MELSQLIENIIIPVLVIVGAGFWDVRKALPDLTSFKQIVSDVPVRPLFYFSSRPIPAGLE